MSIESIDCKPIKDTILYKIIEKCNEDLARKVEEAYRIAYKILKNVKIYFPDETDHGIGHSLRIIWNIENLLIDDMNRNRLEKLIKRRKLENSQIKKEIGLSVYDLYFLILGALFHDIGMCPDRITFREIAKVVLDKDVSLDDWKSHRLSEEEVEKIRKYIKKMHGEISAKMVLADSLEYDEKEEGGRVKLQNLIDVKLDVDEFYRKILAAICEGHKVKFEDLLRFLEERKLKTVSYGGERLHIFVLIVLLQLADDLDITEKRTPDLVYELYIKGETDEKEELVWIAHKCVKDIYRDGNVIYINGSCEDPRAYAQFVRYIRRVEDKLKRTQIILSNEECELKIKSLLPTVINIDGIIKEGFIATDLRLNLAGKEIVELLSSQLYGNDWKVAIRELLQNAIDACKYRALEEFKKGNYDYKPRIEIEYKDRTLIVRDNGKGMTLDEIREFLLNIGRCYYKELDDKVLKEINPISMFGIGILSCFMLADKIEIETRSMFEDKAYRIEINKDLDEPVIVWGSSKKDIGTEVRLKRLKEAPFNVINVLRSLRDIAREKDPLAILSILRLEQLKDLALLLKGKKKVQQSDVTEIITKIKEGIVGDLREEDVINYAINFWLVDTRYSVGDRIIPIEICYNGRCQIPTIEDEFKKLCQEIIEGDTKIFIFENNSEDYNCKLAFYELKSIFDPSDLLVIAYNGIFIPEDSRIVANRLLKMASELLDDIKATMMDYIGVIQFSHGICGIIDIRNPELVEGIDLSRRTIKLSDRFWSKLVKDFKE